MEELLNNPTSKDLQLYVPGYAYFQGVVYSKGNISALGPVRIIGGVICQTPDDSATKKQIILQKGAMLTTNPDYLKRTLTPPALKLKVTRWEEKATNVKETD
jgi:hypothetical protein